jgi:hypothetical protein
LNVEGFPTFQQALQLPSSATAVFAEMLENLQHSMQLIPKS